jgi:cytochrome c peroxidase
MKSVRKLGTAAVLASGVLSLSTSAHGQLPLVPTPPENPTTPAKVVLGKILFWEEQLSSDNTTACGTCHIPSHGGGDPRSNTPLNIHPGPDGAFGTADDIRGSRGVVATDCDGSLIDDGVFFPNPQVTRRKAPSMIGAAWAPSLFWDGRAFSEFEDPDTGIVTIPFFAALESQAVGPVVSSVEMACGMRTHADVAAKIAAAVPLRLAASQTPDIVAALAVNPTYPDLFNAAFGDSAVTSARIGMAIAAYERTLIPDQTPFDAFNNGNTSALTASQQLGLQVFNTNGRCNLCHSGPNFTDDTFVNLGVRPNAEDTGREEVTSDPNDMAKFRVPSLRNAGLRAPFFHNGGKPTMTLVVNFYKLGGDFPSANLDPRLQPLIISHTEETALADFVSNALTDPRVALELPPFDRPILHSEINVPATLGTPETATGGFPFRAYAPLPPFYGNDRFSFGVTGGVGGAAALAAFSFDPAPPGTMLGLHNVYVDLNALVVGPFTLGGPFGVAGKGFFSFNWDIPNDPNLSEVTLFAQFVAVDASSPDGLVASDGIQFTVF